MSEKENKISLRKKLGILKTYLVGGSSEIKSLGDHNKENDFYGDIGEYYNLTGILISSVALPVGLFTLNPLLVVPSTAYLADAGIRFKKWDFCCDAENHYHGPGLIGTLKDKLSGYSKLEKSLGCA